MQQSVLRKKSLFDLIEFEKIREWLDKGSFKTVIGKISNTHRFYIFSVVTLVAIVLLSYKRSKGLASRQSEARIQLQIIASLANAYYIEFGQFVFFNEPYGAPDQSNHPGNCTVPVGSKTLGFSIRHCDTNDEEKKKRYFFQLLEKEDKTGFIARATSGTGPDGLDLVCDHPDKKDIWEIDRNKNLVNVRRCEQ